MPREHPIPFRPPAAEREWLDAYAERTGQAVNAILTTALQEHRSRLEHGRPGLTPAEARQVARLVRAALETLERLGP